MVLGFVYILQNSVLGQLRNQFYCKQVSKFLGI